MKKYLLKLSAFVLVVAGLSSCLKDGGFDDNKYQALRGTTDGQKVVSIALTTDVNTNESQISVLASSTASVVNLVPVTISGGVVAEQDVHVVLDTVMSLATAAGYTLPDPAKYSIVSKTVTIPKGQATAYMQIRLNVPNDFIGDAYALGVKIVSVDGGYIIAGNGKSKGVAAFAIANEFEGNYANNGVRYSYAATSIAYTYPGPIPPFTVSALMPNPKFFATVDANRNVFDFANQGAAGQQYLVTTPSGLTGNAEISVPTVLTPLTMTMVSNVDIQVHTYNPALKRYHFVTVFNNNVNPAAGQVRILDETLTKLP
jgi:hypothetical protein